MAFLYIALLAVAVYFVIRASQGSAEPVQVEATELGTDGRIEAIEYFWRPG